jgi:hypothetical protein
MLLHFEDTSIIDTRGNIALDIWVLHAVAIFFMRNLRILVPIELLSEKGRILLP